MSYVPYRDARPARRRTLDRDAVVAAALRVLDEVGLDELTMRRLADRLGVKAASLYHHVRDKDELLVLVADAIAGEMEPPPPGAWRERLAALARSYRRTLASHRDGARVLAATAPLGARRLRQIDTVLGILLDAGVPPRDVARAAYHLNNFVVEFAADEARFGAAAGPHGPGRRKAFEEVRRHFRSLPPAEFPAVHALADELSEDDPDALFEFGLELWLRALDTLAPRGRGGRR